MIKSKIKKVQITNREPDDFEISSVTTYDVINDTRDFLTYHFKGAYQNLISGVSYRRAVFSTEGFAYILKLIFKAVFGRDLISVSNRLLDDSLEFILKFDTKYIDDVTIEKINSTAQKSNLELEFTDKSVSVKIPTVSDFTPIVSAITIRKVYNSLNKIFFA